MSTELEQNLWNVRDQLQLKTSFFFRSTQTTEAELETEDLLMNSDDSSLIKSHCAILPEASNILQSGKIERLAFRFNKPKARYVRSV